MSYLTDPQKVTLDELFDTPREEQRYEGNLFDDDLIRGTESSGIASLFSANAGE